MCLPYPSLPGTLPTLLLIYPGAKELMKCHPPLHQADSPVCWLLILGLMIESCFSPGRMNVWSPARGASCQVVQEASCPTCCPHTSVRVGASVGRQEEEGKRSRPEKLNVHKCRPGAHKVGQSH